MNWRTILPALAAMAFASTISTGWAQSKGEDPNQSVPQKIRERLTAEGYQDVQVAAGSYVVSAKDKGGHRVMMVIGPTSTTVVKIPDDPSTAQVPAPNKDEIIQE
jgi:Peptidase propeptide and YPEB domain